MKPRSLSVVLLAVLGVACSRTIVNPGDTTPPTLKIHITPDAVYADDGSAVTNPVEVTDDVARKVSIPAPDGTHLMQINAVATDEESAISTVKLTINADFSCATPSSSSAPVHAHWVKENGTPDEPGEETYTTSNVIVSVNGHGFWNRGGCAELDDPPAERGYLRSNIQGRYTARACNNANAPAGTPLCHSVTGEFNFTTHDLAVP